MLAAGQRGADEERFSLDLRGGGFNRDDGGYADHAEVYGLANPELAAAASSRAASASCRVSGSRLLVRVLLPTGRGGCPSCG